MGRGEKRWYAQVFWRDNNKFNCKWTRLKNCDKLSFMTCVQGTEIQRDLYVCSNDNYCSKMNGSISASTMNDFSSAVQFGIKTNATLCWREDNKETLTALYWNASASARWTCCLTRRSSSLALNPTMSRRSQTNLYVNFLLWTLSWKRNKI